MRNPVEFRKNGEFQIRITPTDSIESAIIDAMVARAQQGASVRLSIEEGIAVIRMDAQ